MISEAEGFAAGKSRDDDTHPRLDCDAIKKGPTELQTS